MGLTKSLILFKANGIDFANWLNEYFESRKENLYEIPPSQNSQGTIVWITECRIKFEKEKKNGHGNMRGWVNVDGAFDLFIDESTTEESGTSAPNRAYLPIKLPITLYEIAIFPTTKGIMVNINGRPEIEFEQLITAIYSQWEGEEIDPNRTPKINISRRRNSDSNLAPILESFTKRIEDACSLLQGNDDTARNRIIVVNWWNGKTAIDTAWNIRSKELGDLVPKTIYNIRRELAKTYPGIAPPRMNRKKQLKRT